VRLIFPILLGVLGCAVLIALGSWQVQRMTWKQAILAEIDSRIMASAVVLPQAPDPVADGWRPVTAVGALTGQEARVLTTQPDLGGPGYRVIGVLVVGARRVLVDLGYVPQAARDVPRAAPLLEITGNLHWPDEVDGWTPPPDTGTGVWYARDIPAIALAMDAEPFLVVARALSPNDLGVTPLPVDTATIPNDHREYAITWFLMAAVWAAMSGYLVWRTARRT
jgi:surfeit locus 1 family protein